MQQKFLYCARLKNNKILIKHFTWVVSKMKIQIVNSQRDSFSGSALQRWQARNIWDVCSRGEEEWCGGQHHKWVEENLFWYIKIYYKLYDEDISKFGGWMSLVNNKIFHTNWWLGSLEINWGGIRGCLAEWSWISQSESAVGGLNSFGLGSRFRSDKDSYRPN